MINKDKFADRPEEGNKKLRPPPKTKGIKNPLMKSSKTYTEHLEQSNQIKIKQ